MTINLLGLEAFRVAGRTLSFKQAASELGLTPSAISHRVRALELDLGFALFHRHTRALSLTLDGKTYLKKVETFFTNLEKETDRLRQLRASRPLRLSVLPLFATAILIPRLARFHAAHPDITIDLDTRSDIRDLDAGDTDIGIRNLQSAPTGKGVTKLVDTKGILLCTPDIAKRVTCIDDLKNETIIHCAPRPNGWPDWFRQQGAEHLKAKRDLWLDTIPAGLEAAALGQGVILTLSPLAKLTHAGQSLVEPFSTKKFEASSYYLVHRPEDVSDHRIQAFKTWLMAELRDLKRETAKKKTG